MKSTGVTSVIFLALIVANTSVATNASGSYWTSWV